MEKKIEIPLWLAERLMQEMKARNKEEYITFLKLYKDVHEAQTSTENLNHE